MKVTLLLVALGIVTRVSTVACVTAETEQPVPVSSQLPAYECIPITEVPICSELGYEYASFPNMRNQRHQSEANSELAQWKELLEAGCSDVMVHLLCAIYAPFCTTDIPNFVPYPPCKDMCDYTRNECEPVLEEHGLTWPTAAILNCSTYTSRRDDRVGCIPLGDVTFTEQPQPPAISPVEDFDITAEGAHSLTFSWQPPKYSSVLEKLFYVVTCVPNPEGFPHVFTDHSTEHVTLGGFQADSEYECSVVPVTSEVTGSSVSKSAKTLTPLELLFVNDTPAVSNATLKAQFEAKRPVSRISCQLLRQPSSRKDCSNGSVTFAFLTHGTHTLRVVAENSKHDRAVLRRKVKVSRGPEYCAVHLINAGVSIHGGSNATIEFTGTGPVERFVCKLDRSTAENCASPYSLSNLGEGRHLRIIPMGKKCRRKKYSYSIMV